MLIARLRDGLLKLAADKDHGVHSLLFIAGCVLYALSALAWFPAMRHISLAQAGVTYTMLTLLALCALVVLVFDEKLSLREIAGIACAVAATILLVRFT